MDATLMPKGFAIRDPRLVAALDLLVASARRRYPGRRISRESLARELLYRALPPKVRPQVLSGPGTAGANQAESL
jgi:hypothetical protein